MRGRSDRVLLSLEFLPFLQNARVRQSEQPEIITREGSVTLIEASLSAAQSSVAFGAKLTFTHGSACLCAPLATARPSVCQQGCAARCQRMMISGLTIAQSRQGRRGTKPNKQKTIGIVEVPSFRCPPAKHIDLCRRIRISASSFAPDLKSKVGTPRISLNRSFIRSRTYPVCSLRPC
jgi:hypothetical protein